MMGNKGNNSLIREPSLLERVGQTCARLEKLANNIEAAGGVPGDRNAASWLRHTITLIRKVQKENTTERQRVGSIVAKNKTRKALMKAYQNRIKDLQQQLAAAQEGMGRNAWLAKWKPKAEARGPDRDLRAVGSIIKAGDPITMAQQIAEGINGMMYVYKMRTGSCVLRKQATNSPNAELVGVYDEGADWREIASDLTA